MAATPERGQSHRCGSSRHRLSKTKTSVPAHLDIQPESDEASTCVFPRTLHVYHNTKFCVLFFASTDARLICIPFLQYIIYSPVKRQTLSLTCICILCTFYNTLCYILIARAQALIYIYFYIHYGYYAIYSTDAPVHYTMCTTKILRAILCILPLFLLGLCSM